MKWQSLSQKLVGNKDERAVSPVIGVILMVAITVILAAVIAAFVLDMGDMGETAPQASINWDEDSGFVTIAHESGETLNSDEIRIEGVGSGSDNADDWADSGEISAGASAKLESTGDEIKIIWEADDGSSQVLDRYEPSTYAIRGTAMEINHGDSGSVIADLSGGTGASDGDTAEVTNIGHSTDVNIGGLSVGDQVEIEDETAVFSDISFENTGSSEETVTITIENNDDSQSDTIEVTLHEE